jgi:hypothetical protein
MLVGLAMVPLFAHAHGKTNISKGGVKVMAEPSSGVSITRAKVQKHHDEVTVSGVLQPRSPLERQAGHVDILIIDSAGEVIHQQTTSTMPRKFYRKSIRKPHFSTVLKTVPPAGAVVRIVHHAGKAANCTLR